MGVVIVFMLRWFMLLRFGVFDGGRQMVVYIKFFTASVFEMLGAYKRKYLSFIILLYAIMGGGVLFVNVSPMLPGGCSLLSHVLVRLAFAWPVCLAAGLRKW